MALAGGLAWLAAPASSGTNFNYAECSFSADTGVLRVQVNDEEGLVRRHGDRILVRVPTGSGDYETVQCDGGEATVENTERLRLKILSEGFTQGRLSLFGGPLAPGLTPEEDGSSEIEVVASMSSRNEELRLEGTEGPDLLRGGSLGEQSGVNLNPASEPESPDSDLRLVRGGGATTAFATGKGADVVALDGGAEFDGPLELSGWVNGRLGRGADRFVASQTKSVVWAGDGADRVVTGKRRDIVYGGSGEDRIRTGGSRDGVLLGRGRDRVWTMGGRDVILAADGERDRVDCGAGRDQVIADRVDRLVSCERVEDPSGF